MSKRHRWALPPGVQSNSRRGQRENGAPPDPAGPRPYRDISSPSDGDALSLTEESRDSRWARTLNLNPAYTFENFVVGSCNRIAQAAALSICDRHEAGILDDVYNPLLIYGGSGTGKTHLLHSVCERMLQITSRHVVYQSGEEYTNSFIASSRSKSLASFRGQYRHADVLAIDDVGFLSVGAKTQEEFFHTLSALIENGTRVILTCSRSPRDCCGLQQRLVSRLQSGLVARLEPPDVETRARILLTKARFLDSELPQEVAELLATRVRGDLREVVGALSRVLNASSSDNVPVSLEFARSVLDDQVSPGAVTIPQILEAVEEHFHVTRKELLSRSKVRSLVHARQTGMYLARKLTPLSLEEIGRQFGGRDHTTVIYALHRIEESGNQRPDVKATLHALRNTISSQRLL